MPSGMVPPPFDLTELGTFAEEVIAVFVHCCAFVLTTFSYSLCAQDSCGNQVCTHHLCTDGKDVEQSHILTCSYSPGLLQLGLMEMLRPFEPFFTVTAWSGRVVELAWYVFSS
jgi:hypothetical protein